MRVRLALILVLSIALASADLLYVYSGPVLGEADEADLSMDYSLLSVLNLSEEDVGLNEDILSLYDARPYARDPGSVYFRYSVLNAETLDVMGTGIVLWEIGAFDPSNNSLPTTVASSFYPGFDLLNEPEMSPSWGPGRNLACIPIDWLAWVDSAGNNPLVFSADQEYLEAYSHLWRTSFERMSFAESVLDGKAPWKGIYYLAYYPNQNKTFLVLKSTGEVGDVRLDSSPAAFTAYYPFVVLEGSLLEGDHNVEVEAAGRNYSLGFEVAQSSLRVSDYVVEGDRLYLVVYSSDDIYLERVSVLGSSQDLDLLISAGSYARVNLTLPRAFEDRDYFRGDVLFEYVLGGEKQTYLRHLEGTVSYW